MCEVGFVVALKVQKGRQVAVIDADVALFGNGWLCVECDAGAGQFQHAQIICAIANGQHVLRGLVSGGTKLLQGLDFGVAAQDRAADLTGQDAIFDQESVGAVMIKAKARGDGLREGCEAAGHQGAIGAVLFHRVQ